ncbi:hypothetical protein [Tenuifilum osseticum]|uniref:hypothetical protein n=1 Tax=Tenuifilum osseticum TaxID=3374723 RepID=UPI0034E44F2D
MLDSLPSHGSSNSRNHFRLTGLNKLIPRVNEVGKIALSPLTPSLWLSFQSLYLAQVATTG